MTNPNDPAMPETYEVVRAPNTDRALMLTRGGLTKREAFAMTAMQGMLADPERSGKPSDFARDAVRYADALITALNATEDK